MILHDHPMEWYLSKLRAKDYFSLGMYGDGEWQCIFNTSQVAGRMFPQNAEKTVYYPELSRQMYESLKYRGKGFYFSAPNTFKLVPSFHIYEEYVDLTLQQLGVQIPFVEKNMWNEEMKAVRLAPLIDELKKHNLCIISNPAMRGLNFLHYDKFIDISYPNCWEDGSLERAGTEAIKYGKPGVYLVAAGIPATLLVQRLHQHIPNSFILDLGSIWDIFCGTGGQRTTRKDYYNHPDQLKKYLTQTLGQKTAEKQLVYIYKTLEKQPWKSLWKN